MTPEKHLPRVLRFFDISVLSSASMAPAYSLASTMGPMIVAAGTFAPLSLLSVSAIMLCIAIGYAQLSRVAPNAGSSYSWIRLAFGAYAGAYGAWLLILSNVFATLATAVPAGIYTLDLLAPGRAQNPVWDAAVGAAWIAGSAVLLYAGVRPTALVTAAALALEIGVVAVAAVFAWLSPHVPSVHPAAGSDVKALAFSGFGFIYAMTLGVWMSDGWELSAATSEEVAKDPAASGRGGITGLLVTTATLAVAMFAFDRLGTLGGFKANEADAMRYVADLLGAPIWRPIILTTVLVSTSSALWTTLLYLSRSVFAMGRDRVLPRSLGTLDAREEPFWSLVVTAVLVIGVELLTGLSPTARAQLDFVVNGSSLFLGLLFAASAAAAVRIFWRKPAYRWTGVVIPGAGLVALMAVLGATVIFEDRTSQIYAAGGIVVGVPLALWRGWASSKAMAGEPPGQGEPTALAL
ncbi:MAG TPA: APC family permease [Candidatus Rubrimentiphilum sp.]|nr:APC family permease [Candidatus Rubrimentiphilum sp.]